MAFACCYPKPTPHDSRLVPQAVYGVLGGGARWHPLHRYDWALRPSLWRSRSGARAVHGGNAGFLGARYRWRCPVCHLELLDAGAPVSVAVGTGLAVNLRMALYSASLVPYLGRAPPAPSRLGCLCPGRSGLCPGAPALPGPGGIPGRQAGLLRRRRRADLRDMDSGLRPRGPGPKHGSGGAGTRLCRAPDLPGYGDAHVEGSTQRGGCGGGHRPGDPGP